MLTNISLVNIMRTTFRLYKLGFLFIDFNMILMKEFLANQLCLEITLSKPSTKKKKKKKIVNVS